MEDNVKNNIDLIIFHKRALLVLVVLCRRRHKAALMAA